MCCFCKISWGRICTALLISCRLNAARDALEFDLADAETEAEATAAVESPSLATQHLVHFGVRQTSTRWAPAPECTHSLCSKQESDIALPVRMQVRVRVLFCAILCCSLRVLWACRVRWPARVQTRRASRARPKRARTPCAFRWAARWKQRNEATECALRTHTEHHLKIVLYSTILYIYSYAYHTHL